jgi:hypothetical protein
MEMIAVILLEDVFEKDTDGDSVIQGFGELRSIFQNKEELFCYLSEVYKTINKKEETKTKEEELIFNYLKDVPKKPNEKKDERFGSTMDQKQDNNNEFTKTRYTYLKEYIKENDFVCDADEIVKDIAFILTEKDVNGDDKFTEKEEDAALTELGNSIRKIKGGKWKNTFLKTDGSLYGETQVGGALNDDGTWKIHKPSDGNWEINNPTESEEAPANGNWIIHKPAAAAANIASGYKSKDKFICFIVRQNNYLDLSKKKNMLNQYQKTFYNFLQQNNVIKELNKLRKSCEDKDRELLSLKKGVSVVGFDEKFVEFHKAVATINLQTWSSITTTLMDIATIPLKIVEEFILGVSRDIINILLKPINLIIGFCYSIALAATQVVLNAGIYVTVNILHKLNGLKDF